VTLKESADVIFLYDIRERSVLRDISQVETLIKQYQLVKISAYRDFKLFPVEVNSVGNVEYSASLDKVVILSLKHQLSRYMHVFLYTCYR